MLFFVIIKWSLRVTGNSFGMKIIINLPKLICKVQF